MKKVKCRCGKQAGGQVFLKNQKDSMKKNRILPNFVLDLWICFGLCLQEAMVRTDNERKNK